MVGGSLLALLALSLAANAYLYPRATTPLYDAHDRPLIERTFARAAVAQRVNAEALRANSLPIVFRLPGRRTCVEIRSADGSGFYTACYGPEGQVVEEIASVD